MYLQTANNDRVKVTNARDFTYTRYAGALLTDVVDGSYLQKSYTTNGSDGTRFASVDYQGISRNTFPIIKGTHILWIENIQGIRSNMAEPST